MPEGSSAGGAFGGPPKETVVYMSQDVLKRNNVKTLGRGSRAMLFAHGFGCDQNMWRFVTPSFEDDFRVVLFDYVGSGKSDVRAYDARKYSALEGYAQDVLDVCHALNLSGAVFVGHSVSGVVGLLASIREPRLFSRLILVGPSPCYVNHPPDYHGGFERADIEGLLDLMDKNYIGWANFLAPVVVKNPERPEIARELEESFCSTDPRVARRFAEATFLSDYRGELRKAPVPSLIMQCTDDAIAPREVGEYMSLHTPRSTLRVLEATGHCPHMSHPEETARVIREYLDAEGLS